MDPQLLQKIDLLMRSFEFACGVPSTLINLYSIAKVSQLSLVNPNLKYVLNAISFTSALIACIHPILGQIDPNSYSIDRSNYVGAFVYYSLHFSVQLFTLITDLKFFLIGWERRLSLKYKNNLENRNGKRVVFSAIVFLLLICFIKCAVLLNTSELKAMNDRLYEICAIQGHDIFLVVIAFPLGAISWGYGQYKQRHSGTLSERFELRQTNTIVKVLYPLAYLYSVGYLVCLAAVPVIFFLRTKGYGMNTIEYQVATNIIFNSMACYNLIYVVFILFTFAPLRRALINDLCLLIGTTNYSASNSSSTVEPALTLERHFDMLQAAWNKS
ncbi:hypothetical protein M3Y98_00804800 [Aphelenchoides besseyi]|nr:hypothetical protein M3Y98_00804800 [Aphelenchoides besseyi]